MLIGEVARQVGLATSAIRFYEHQGLLPAPERTPSGYRDYAPVVVERLTFIRAGQALGLTLAELRSVLEMRDRGEPPCRHVSELVDDKIDEVERRIVDLENLRKELTRLRKRAAKLDPADCPPEAVCQIITRRGDRAESEVG